MLSICLTNFGIQLFAFLKGDNWGHKLSYHMIDSGLSDPISIK